MEQEIVKSNMDAVTMHIKQEARKNALLQSPSRKRSDDGSEIPLTASERIIEAEIIYQWLIKDL